MRPVRVPPPPSRPRIDGRRLSHPVSAVLRRLAVRSVAAGEKPVDVMRRFGLCRTTIYRWMRRADGPLGLGALGRRVHPGRAPRLESRQAQAVKGWIVGRTPASHGLPAGLWTRTSVSALVRSRLGVALHPVSAGRLLRRIGLDPGLALEDPPSPHVPSLAFATDGRGAFLCCRLTGREGTHGFGRSMATLRRGAGRRRVSLAFLALPRAVPKAS